MVVGVRSRCDVNVLSEGEAQGLPEGSGFSRSLHSNRTQDTNDPDDLMLNKCVIMHVSIEDVV